MKRSSLHYTVLFVAGASLTGCMAKNGALRGPGTGGSNSVVAAIEGISEEDFAREGMQYWLVCDNNVRVDGKVKADRTSVEFAGDKIKNDMVCAMEVKVSEEEGEKLDWNWFGVANGKPMVGLMYGSSKGKVSGRALTLTLYRLYAPKAALSFSAELAVSLELAEGTSMPAEDKTVASLVCSETESFPGTYKKETENHALLTFPGLKIKDLKDRACKKVALLVENQEAYSGEADVAFETPEKDQVLKFPKEEDKRYTLKVADVSGSVHVGTIPGGTCLNYEDSDCKDRRVVALAGQKNYVVAKVMGLKGDSIVTFYVGAGEEGFGQYESASLDVQSINKAARSAAGTADRKAFSFYTSDIAANLFKTPFDADFVSGKAFESYRASESDLASVMLTHIDNLRVHGMHEVAADILNKDDSAYWLAVVKAKKDSEEKEFIVTGNERYFHSASAPATADNKPVYLNMETVLSDMASGSPQKYRAYALKGGIMAPQACSVEKSGYLSGISAKHIGLMGDADASIDACEITGSSFSSAVGTGYIFTPTLYRFGWLEIK